MPLGRPFGTSRGGPHARLVAAAVDERTAVGRREVGRAGWRALRDRGLLSAEGPDPETVRLMRLLAGPARRFGLRASWRRPVRTMAARSGSAGRPDCARRAAAEAARLARMLAGGPGRAQIVAMVTDGIGLDRRLGGVLAVLDGPGGRYLLTRTVGADAVERSTVAPVDPQGLHRLLEVA